jgi:hypothetical protein
MSAVVAMHRGGLLLWALAAAAEVVVVVVAVVVDFNQRDRLRVESRDYGPVSTCGNKQHVRQWSGGSVVLVRHLCRSNSLGSIH